MKRSLLTLLSLLVGISAYSQQQVNLTLIRDDNAGSSIFKDLFKEEVNALLGSQYDIRYTEIDGLGSDPKGKLQEIYKGDTDILVTMGFVPSAVLQSLGTYPKPSLAGISINRSKQETTGIDNFNYIQSPFNVKRDLELFKKLYPYKKLGIFVDVDLAGGLKTYFNGLVGDTPVQYISASSSPEQDLNKLDQDVDAIYVLPRMYNNAEDNQKLIDGINNRKLPSFSLIGRRDVEDGVLASVVSSDFTGIYARRMALNVMKILDGKNPKDFPVQIQGTEEEFIVNAGTLKKIGLYPPFEVLSEASFVNLMPTSGLKYSINSAIAQALDNNIGYQVAQQDVRLQKNEIGIAKSNLLPSVDASSRLVTLDSNSAKALKATNQVTPQTKWSGHLGVSQLIYSEPAWANVSVQKSLLRASEEGLKSQKLDLALEVITAYIRHLQVVQNLEVQNANVEQTQRNLNIAKTKAKVGSASMADVYGLESQLAINKSNLEDVLTQINQSRINLNRLLNRPLAEEFILEDIDEAGQFFIADERVFNQINNHNDIMNFSDFLVNHFENHSPELEQLNWSIKAQERFLTANKRSYYSPTIALQGSGEKTLGRYGIRVPDQTFRDQGVSPYTPTGNIALNVSLPLYQGGERSKKVQKSKIQIEKLNLSKDQLRQGYTSNIRSQLENLGNSYNDIQYSNQAERSSAEYLKIVQDLYREGVVDITALLNAQNNALGSKLREISARYQFFIDAVTIERLINKIYLLSTDSEKEQFVNAYFDYILKNKIND